MTSNKSKLQKATISIVLTLVLAVAAVAGERHAGYGTTKIAAMEQANEVAREAAKKKGTCWRSAKIEDCVKDADGYWTAYADSANHRGSCGRDGYREP